MRANDGLGAQPHRTAVREPPDSMIVLGTNSVWALYIVARICCSFISAAVSILLRGVFS